MGVTPAEATNTNVGGQARPTRHDSENKVEDNQVGERLEKIQNIVTLIVRLKVTYV